MTAASVEVWMRGERTANFAALEHLYYTPMNAKDAAREVEQGTGPWRFEFSGPREQCGGGELALRYALPELPLVAADTDSADCGGGVQRDSFAGADACATKLLGWQHAEGVYAAGKRCIWAFWHRVIIPIVWWHRNHGTVVMNTTAFDGQWTRKVIEWLGFGTAQGSSSRGGTARIGGDGPAAGRMSRLRVHD